MPLKQLSLADVQNVNDVIKSAETAGTSAKAESAVGAAEKSQGAPPLSAAKPAGATAAQLTKLHYGWKKGQNYVYRVRIVGDRGNDTENRSGEVTYRVKSTQFG